MSDPLPPTGPSSDGADGEELPIISDHVLIRRIGGGSYGDVWLAKNNVIGSFRAVKVVYRRRFVSEHDYLCELRAIRIFDPISLSHPGLVTILQVGQNEQAGYFYYVMELADDARSGQTIDTDTYLPRTLKEEMANAPHRPLNTSVQIALSLTSALGFLHAQGLIHRDIKPTNIIFVNGVPKIADVGLITEAGEDVSGRGTIYYMPSEGPGEPTADIFGLGKVFYELFMGLHPKHFPELPDAAVEFTTVPELLQVNRLILKACHHNPRQRFQTTTELHKALRAVATAVQEKQPGTGTTETTGRSASAKPDLKPGSKTALPEGRPITGSEERPKARWTRRVALLALLLVVTCAFLAMQFWKGDGVVSSAAPSSGVVLTATNLVAVLMDTTAEHGIYDEDNKRTGDSNAKELFGALRDILPPENIHQVPVGLDWARQDYVRSFHPDIVIIHRSVFYHPIAAALGLPYPPFTNHVDQKNNHEEFQQFEQRYKVLGDNKLRDFLDSIGAAEPRTRFLVYSRGTDTNWLSAEFRQKWIKELGVQYPALAGRVETMHVKTNMVPGGMKGSFRDPQTRNDLRRAARKILGLPEQHE